MITEKQKEAGRRAREKRKALEAAFPEKRAERLAKEKAYRQSMSPEKKAAYAARAKAWRKTAAGKASLKKYRSTKGAKDAKRRYRKSPRAFVRRILAGKLPTVWCKECKCEFDFVRAETNHWPIFSGRVTICEDCQNNEDDNTSEDISENMPENMPENMSEE
jgi:hypothetical protein